MCASSRSLRPLAALVAAALVACSPASDPPVLPGPASVHDSADEDADIHASLDHLDRGLVRLEPVDGGDAVDVAVTLPTTDQQFRRGLMGVPWLEAGTGMLFDFGRERTGGFWMKDTLVPLDIAFAADDGEVLAVLAMEPCEAEPCPTYDPQLAYRYALEVPQGWFATHDLGAGDRLVPEPDA